VKWGKLVRGAIVGDIVKTLNDNSSRGVLIAGPRGVGKTWMLGQVRDALASTSHTIKLSPSKALSTIPFGAVNARAGNKFIRSSDHYQVLDGLLEEIKAGLEESGHVALLVDNGQFLDEQSAAIITQAIMSTDAKLVLVDQPGKNLTHLEELWRDGHLSRFEFAPLDSSDVRDFLESELAGQLAGPAIDYLASRSDGNPLILKGLVSGALEDGSLRQAQGVWILDHPSDNLGSEWREFLQMDLERLQPGARRAVEFLALAGPLPLDVVLGLVGPEAVDDIQQREMVFIIPGNPMTVRLARTATAAHIRRLIPVGRSRRLLEDISEIFLPRGERHPETKIAFTRWAVDCGWPVSDEEILAAATLANQLMKFPDALKISSLDVGPESMAALLAQRSIAHTNQKREDVARTYALKSLELAPTPDVGAAAIHAIHLAFFSDPDYKSHLDAALSRYDETFGAPSLGPDATRAGIDVLVVRAASELTLGEGRSAATRLEALLTHPMTANRVDQTLLKSMLCEVYTITGRIKEASRLALEVLTDLESLEGFPRPDIAVLAYARAVSSLIYDGAWHSARLALAPSVFTNADLMLVSGGLKDLGWAMMHARQGRIELALDVLNPAVATMIDYDPWLVLPIALGLLAYCLAMRGDMAGAQARLDEFGALTTRANKFYQIEGAAYAAAAKVLIGDRAPGMAQLELARQECEDLGYYGTELTVISLLMRVGDASVVQRFGKVVNLIESGNKALFQNWAGALESQDPTDLELASATAMDFGYELVAVELATIAQKRFNDHGKVHMGRRAASRVVALREQVTGLGSPAIRSADMPKLTRRETEIALLVARGESNNAIAVRLNVSLRTVEGHLYRTFIKLDIQSREQLGTLMKHRLPGEKDFVSA